MSLSVMYAWIWVAQQCQILNLTCAELFQDNDLSEFDESRDIIESLVDEYKACESPDYIKWGMEVLYLILTVCFLFVALVIDLK